MAYRRDFTNPMDEEELRRLNPEQIAALTDRFGAFNPQMVAGNQAGARTGRAGEIRAELAAVEEEPPGRMDRFRDNARGEGIIPAISPQIKERNRQEALMAQERREDADPRMMQQRREMQGFTPMGLDPEQQRNAGLGKDILNIAQAWGRGEQAQPSNFGRSMYLEAVKNRQLEEAQFKQEQNARLKAERGEDVGPNIGKYNPSDYTSKSWTEFFKNGYSDPAVLKRQDPHPPITKDDITYVWDQATNQYEEAAFGDLSQLELMQQGHARMAARHER